MAAETKKWTALHYLVAVTDDDPAADEHLRQEARKEIEAIVAAAQAHLGDMHVAYQIEHWKLQNGVPQRVRVAARAKVTSRTSAPIEEVVTLATSGEPHRGDDLQRFFEWVVNPGSPGHSPADRTAVFFWGHSAGPAGIFDLLEGTAQGSSLNQGVTRRTPGGLVNDVLVKVALPTLSNALDTLRIVDVVLFKDCWMACAEVVCELAGPVDTVIASQSQIPIVGIWPYDDLYGSLAALATPPGPIPSKAFKPLLCALGRLYEQLIPGQTLFPSVPLSLLYVQASLALGPALGGLAGALGQGASLTPAQRKSREALMAASTGFLPDAPGDIALVDMRTMCERLADGGDPATVAAAAALDRALEKVVAETVSRPAAPGCRGLSLFYYPADPRKSAAGHGATDPGVFNNGFLTNAVPRAGYRRLRLNASPDSWADIAFEQDNPL